MSEFINLNFPIEEKQTFRTFDEFYKHDVQNRKRIDAKTNENLKVILDNMAENKKETSSLSLNTQVKRSKMM